MEGRFHFEFDTLYRNGRGEITLEIINYVASSATIFCSELISPLEDLAVMMYDAVRERYTYERNGNATTLDALKTALTDTDYQFPKKLVEKLERQGVSKNHVEEAILAGVRYLATQAHVPEAVKEKKDLQQEFQCEVNDNKIIPRYGNPIGI